MDRDGMSRYASTIEKAAMTFVPHAVYRALGRTLWPRHVEAVDNVLPWHRAVRDIAGKSILVDASKTPIYLAANAFAYGEKLRVLFLVRDGRAYLRSVRRAHQAMYQRDLPALEAATMWARGVKRLHVVLRRIPRDHVFQVRYEDICRTPLETLRRVCGFLGLDFEKGMTEIMRESSHSIDGNLMRFRADEPEIRLDEAWRSELSRDDLAAFERVGGRLNRSLGYNA